MFEVIVNEETNTKKYIKSTAKGLQFQTWEACIASLFAVEFDASKNPILEKVGAPEPTISYDRNEIYHPNELDGNWLQIKWGNEDHWEYGWIKWRNGEELLIEPFFSG